MKFINKTIALSGKQARGRNRWFKGRTLDLWTTMPNNAEREVVLDVSSQRTGKTPPIVLYLSREDAVAVATGLLEGAEAIQ